MARLSLLKQTWLWFSVWTLLALVVLWQYDLVRRTLDPDASFMLYAGQEILRGHAPYVSVAIVKLPLAPLTAALGIGLGRIVGVDDILAGRIVFWLCAGAAAGATFLIGAQLARDSTSTFSPAGMPPRQSAPPTAAHALNASGWLLGSSSAAVFLSWQALGAQVARGPEAKLPMIAAGMLCLVLIARRRWFWAGVLGALSFLAWQPGLIFVAAAVVSSLLVPLRTPNPSGRERTRAVVIVLAGAALPLALVAAYLAANDALLPMFRQAFGANANYLGEKKIVPGLGSLLLANTIKVWKISLECSAAETPLVVLGYLGLGVGAIYLVWRLVTRRAAGLLETLPLLLSGAALFGFSLLDVQKCSDVTPLLPYLALGAAAALFAGIWLVSRIAGRLGALANVPFLAASGAVMVGAVLGLGARDAFALPRQNGLSQQRALAEQISRRLGPADAVQEFGDTTFLVLTRRENATRFIHLGEKQGLGILSAEGMPIQALVAALQATNPRAILLTRAKNKGWAKPLYAWIAENYTPDERYNAAKNKRHKDLELFWAR